MLLKQQLNSNRALNEQKRGRRRISRMEIRDLGTFSVNSDQKHRFSVCWDESPALNWPSNVRAWGRKRKGEMHGAMAGEMEGIAKKKNPTIEKKIVIVKICKNWLGNEQRALKRAANLADRSPSEMK
jgi:hypothetical protein